MPRGHPPLRMAGVWALGVESDFFLENLI